MISSSIDCEEAAASGLKVITINRYDLEGIKRNQTDQLSAQVEFLRLLFSDLNIKGKVGFYGYADQQSTTWKLLNAIQNELGIEI